MNRRHFFSSVAKAVACFAILPSATTYARKWVTLDSGVVAPYIEIVTDLETVNALHMSTGWNFVPMIPPAIMAVGEKYLLSWKPCLNH